VGEIGDSNKCHDGDRMGHHSLDNVPEGYCFQMTGYRRRLVEDCSLVYDQVVVEEKREEVSFLSSSSIV